VLLEGCPYRRVFWVSYVQYSQARGSSVHKTTLRHRAGRKGEMDVEIATVNSSEFVKTKFASCR
jgi:hypothetical protein